MIEPYLKINEFEVKIIFPINSSYENYPGVIIPKYNFNLTLPEFCVETNRVGIEIFEMGSERHSFTIFKREVFVPHLEDLLINKAFIKFGKETEVIFPKKQIKNLTHN